MSDLSVDDFLSKSPSNGEIREYLKNSSIDRVRDFLRTVSANHNFYRYAETELVAKLAEEQKKTHWSTWLILIFTIVGAIAASLAAYFGWKAI